MQKHETIDSYILDFPPEVQKRMEELRKLIKRLAPESEELISYGIPTFDLNGKHLIHFGAFAKHISIYPFPSGIEEFKTYGTDYKTATGTIQFPHDRELPMDIIERIVKFRLAENAAPTSKR